MREYSDIKPDVRLRLVTNNFTKDDYKVYRRTKHWKKKRKEALEYHGAMCVICDSETRLQVHHRPGGYKNLFNENVKYHLTILCARHHRKIS